MYSSLESDDVVIRRLLLNNATYYPNAPYVNFENGDSWTWRQALAAACGAANILRNAGVRQGDKVAAMLPNGADYLRAWWGTAMLGAILVPINTAFKGSLLGNVLNLSQPVALVVHGDFENRFTSLGPGFTNAIRLAPEDLISNDSSVPPLEQPVELWDIHALMLTSGTTGPSKLSATTFLHTYLGGAMHLRNFECTAEDILLADLPLFHLGAMYLVVATLSTRTRIAVRSKPDLANYWEIVREMGVTCGLLLSTMVPYLLNQPPRDADRLHNMRALLIAPVPRDIASFQTRFGVHHIHTALGSTEIPAPLISGHNDSLERGYCGRPREGLQVRLVDAHDMEVPTGEPGEMVVRPDFPWQVSAGYFGNDAATARAWRNGWFHSGDTLRCDEMGRFFFVDRSKDMVRRRGENISTSEVEAELVTHPGVAEAACVAYRHPDWVDDELKAWIVLKPGAALDFENLLRFCIEKLPHFMVPRYFEVAGQFPKTASLKIEKFALRDRGNGDNTWDREAHGFQLTRQGLRQTAAR